MEFCIILFNYINTDNTGILKWQELYCDDCKKFERHTKMGDKVPMAARVRHGTTPATCVTATVYKSEETVTILKPLMPIPTQPLLHMVQHVTDWAASFPRSQHYPYPPLSNSSKLPFHLLFTCTRVEAIIIITHR